MTVNQEQFQLWHDQYRPRLVESMTALVRNRDTAEDIAATALATAYEKIDQFRGEADFGTAASHRFERGALPYALQKNPFARCLGFNLIHRRE
jgi:hypothetical protein